MCRYFLRGACVREDCPYLHKKLSLKAEICIDFLRGYCSRAANVSYVFKLVLILINSSISSSAICVMSLYVRSLPVRANVS